MKILAAVTPSRGDPGPRKMLGPWLARIMEFTVLEDRQVAGLVCLCVCGGVESRLPGKGGEWQGMCVSY